MTSSNPLPSTQSKSSIHVRLLILGSGPAGLSAALYAARAELAPVVLTGMQLGGQAALTHTIENYPGFPSGIGGSELGELFQKQAERFDAKIEFESAYEVDLTKRPFEIKTDNGEYLADSLIIATGARPNLLQVPGESELTGKGVSYCATCDGAFFRNKHIIVVGGGDSAAEEGIFLTRYADSVTLIHRRDSLRASALVQKRAFENPKIKINWNTIITEIVGKEKVEAVKLKDVQTGQESSMPIDGVFIFIGYTPNTQIFDKQIKIDERGYIIVDQRMQTSVAGVFAAGEVADPYFRQVVTSAGMGAAAAIQASIFLEHE